MPLDADEAICEAFAAGATMAEIGEAYGVTRQRIHQILKKYGIRRQAGGLVVRVRLAKARYEAERDRLHLARWGHTYAEHKKLGAYIRFCYGQQEKMAKAYKIPFHLTLKDWWAIWQASGKWDQRGLARGKYLLGRIDKKGSFTRENARVMTLQENSLATRQQNPRKWRR